MPMTEWLRRRPRATTPAPSHAMGFTLVELMVTLAVLAVVMAIAAPSFTFVRNNARLSGATNEMVATLQLARMDAIRLNGRVTVCRSADGAKCEAGDLWARWITLADTNRDGVTEVIRVAEAATPVEVRASAAIAGSKLEFRPDGLARKADGTLLKANFGVCLKERVPADNQRTITIASGSRVSTKSENKGGACATPGDPA